MYTFDLTIDPDIRVEHRTEGTIKLEFIHPMSLFNFIEELQTLEILLLNALGYGKKEEE